MKYTYVSFNARSPQLLFFSWKATCTLYIGHVTEAAIYRRVTFHDPISLDSICDPSPVVWQLDSSSVLAVDIIKNRFRKREILIPLPLLVTTSDIGLGVASAWLMQPPGRAIAQQNIQPAFFTQSSLRVYLNLHSIPSLPSLKLKHCVTCPSLRSKGPLPSLPPPLRLPTSQTA